MRYRLIHFSDPHLTAIKQISLPELLNKRLFGYMSWHQRRRHRYRPEVLAALVSDLRRQQPEHILITGDLTHLGLADEFRQAKTWLQMLGAPDKVFVVPGNHECYVQTPWQHHLGEWLPYLAGEQSATPDQLFPSVRIDRQLALIGVSSAYPSGLFFATGRLGQKQLAALEQILLETRKRRLVRILLIHHPPLSGIVSWRKALIDHQALIALLKQHGVELILHGHSHQISQHFLTTSQGQTPVLGIAAASSISQANQYRAQYNVLELTDASQGWQLKIKTHRYQIKQRRFLLEQQQELRLPG